MKKIYLFALLIVTSALVLYSCSDNEEDYLEINPQQRTTKPILSPLKIDLSQVPYAKLSDYHFFVGPMKEMNPNYKVIPYTPASTLFTDYALKKRFIWMPEGVKANYLTDDKILDFPVGTILIKSFYYNTIQPGNTTKIIETRMMVRKSDGWKFYEYIWNDAQTDADLVAGEAFTNGSSQTITFRKPNNDVVTTDYRIPSDAECFACHKKNELPTPIGPKPQNLNIDFAYPRGAKNQLLYLKQQGYLSSYPANIVSTVDYHDTTKPLDLRMRSYLDINCAHCHQEHARCDYRALRFAFSETTNPTNLGICVTADEVLSPSLEKLINPGNFDKSVVHFRLISNEESERMPLLGRTIVHDEGVELLEQWISSLTQTCD